MPLNLGLNSAWKYTPDREWNTRSTLWKPLRSSSGLDIDDNDDDDLLLRLKKLIAQRF